MTKDNHDEAYLEMMLRGILTKGSMRQTMRVSIDAITTATMGN
jgi:hypothetical protein